jgi:lipoate---protein ligase
MDVPLKLVRYDLDGLDPYRNLATEEHLARTCPEDTVRLVFYCNAPAVIIGRNQNPWLEADLGEAGRRGVVLARRASGGGAVVHDTGNLNYGFIMPRPLYAPARFLEVVVTALGALGVNAATCRRSSVWVGERKVSGTAFLLTGRTALLHGCILVSSDLERLERLLTPPPAERRTRAVASIRSPVTRLADVAPGLTLSGVREAIAAAAAQEFARVARLERPAADPDPAAIAALTARLRSWEWIYGRTADFAHVLRLPGGAITLHVKGARVAAVEAEGNPDLEAALQGLWSGCRYDGADLAGAVEAARAVPPDLPAALLRQVRQEIPVAAG